MMMLLICNVSMLLYAVETICNVHFYVHVVLVTHWLSAFSLTHICAIFYSLSVQLMHLPMFMLLKIIQSIHFFQCLGAWESR